MSQSSPQNGGHSALRRGSIMWESVKQQSQQVAQSVKTKTKAVAARAVQNNSVFGAAPSLSNMLTMNEMSGNKILFRGAHFWYHFRVYYPYLAPIGILLGIILPVTTWNTVEGHMVIGSILSLCSTLAVVASYLMIVPWRKHPSTIVYYRSITNIFFSFNVLCNAIQYHVDPNKECAGFAVITQFTLMASECWLTTIAIDLVLSLTNPFTSYRGNMSRYHAMVWIFTFLISFALYNQQSCQARFEDGLCWVRILEPSDPCLWGYYFFWIVCMYAYQFGAIIFAFMRLRKGLPLTFEIRKQCALETFKLLMAYGVYQLLLCIFFVALASRPIDTTRTEATNFDNLSKFFLFFISCRGYVDGLVWFLQHDFARDPPAEHDSNDNTIDIEDAIPKQQELPPVERTRSSSGASPRASIANLAENLANAVTEMAEIAVLEFDEADLSPQVNMALRQQIVKYVTMGVTKACTGDIAREISNKRSNCLLRTAERVYNSMKQCAEEKDPRIADLLVTEFLLESEHPFKSFAPDIFRELRMLEGIDDDSFIEALQNTEREQLSEGASGAFMFFCGGGDFIVKTIRASEAHVLHCSLRTYADYLKENPGSLLVRFLGSFSLAVYAQTFHFVIMRNIFEPGIDINERYDIKGSWVGRSADPMKPNKRIVCRHCNEMFLPSMKEKCPRIVGAHEGNVVLKDNDLRTKISLHDDDAVRVMDIIRKDSDLLAEIGVLDYSLIVGVKKWTFAITHDEGDNFSGPGLTSMGSVTQSPVVKRARSGSMIMRKTYATFKAKSVSGPAIYYMGIVDFLQDWNLRKRVERAAKIYIKGQDPEGTSVMMPEPYKVRFQSKMMDIFDLADVTLSTKTTYGKVAGPPKDSIRKRKPEKTDKKGFKALQLDELGVINALHAQSQDKADDIQELYADVELGDEDSATF